MNGRGREGGREKGKRVGAKRRGISMKKFSLPSEGACRMIGEELCRDVLHELHVAIHVVFVVVVACWLHS